MPPRRGQLAPPKPPPHPAAAAAAVAASSSSTTALHQQRSFGTAVLGEITPTPTLPRPTTANTATADTPSSFPSAPPIPASFIRRKKTILAQLSLPDEEYTDLSPKGTVDAGIRELIDEINAVDGLMTTSSCAGRVSVFLEGRRALPSGNYGNAIPGAATAEDGLVEEGQLQLPGHPQADFVEEDGVDGGVESTPAARGPATTMTIAGVGGKGGGGKWLFVSHDPVQMEGKLDSEPNIVAALLGMEEPIFDGRDGCQAEGMSDGGTRLIHFKFEPMILHILTASPYHAQLILRCGLQAGFRESGAINLIPPIISSSASSSSSTATATPIVAIRSMGLGVESLIGRETNGIKHCTVSEEYLKALIRIANERFVENARRIERFRTYLNAVLSSSSQHKKERKGDGEGGVWEDAETRKERKRAEGLRRAEEVRKMREELEQQQKEREREEAQEQQEEQEKV